MTFEHSSSLLSSVSKRITESLVHLDRVKDKEDVACIIAAAALRGRIAAFNEVERMINAEQKAEAAVKDAYGL